MPNAEVGSVVGLKGKYYMLYSGGHLYVSDSPTTGFKIDPNNPEFHTDGYGVHFSRIWNVQGDKEAETETILLTHQWGVSSKTGSLLYLAPIKQAIVGQVG
jgi:hypothetical protein